MCSNERRRNNQTTSTHHDIFLRVLLREECLEIFDGARVVGQLICRVLGVLGKFERGVLRDRALDGLQGISDEMQKGGFAGSVGAEDGDAGVHAAKRARSYNKVQKKKEEGRTHSIPKERPL